MGERYDVVSYANMVLLTVASFYCCPLTRQRDRYGRTWPLGEASARLVLYNLSSRTWPQNLGRFLQSLEAVYKENQAEVFRLGHRGQLANQLVKQGTEQAYDTRVLYTKSTPS